MKPDFKFKPRRQKKLTALLGLTLDGSRLEGVVLRRNNGSLTLGQAFAATLTLDPLTAAPELVGREIRNLLDAAGIRERHCIVGLPLKWVLTMATELPALSEADAASLLEVEAERGFHSDVATLQLASSRAALAGDKQNVLLAGIPTAHLLGLEKVLVAAKLKPVSFGLGLCALQPPADEKSAGVLALAIGEASVALQISAAGGALALRTIEGAVENENGQPVLHAEIVARETRISYGQLPDEIRNTLKRIRIFGPQALARRLADALELRFEPMGLRVEIVSGYALGELGLQLPAEATLSGAFSLAARRLAEQPTPFEFLPPKPTVIELFVAKYSSGRLRTTGAAVAVVVALVAGLFLWQQFQLERLGSQWNAMSVRVGQLQHVQDNIVQYRPWYDGTFPNLAILRQLTLCFTEDGSVTAKNIEIRDGNTITCAGTAHDVQALLAVEKKLAAVPGISGLHHEQSRGKSPMQFVLTFHYNNGGAH